MKNVGDYRDIINNYWFGKKYFEWMLNGSKYDEEIKKEFKWILTRAEKGELEYYKNTKKGFLAYIILLDQMPRHIYRGTEDAYKCDKQVCTFMKNNLDKYLTKYSAIKQMFVLMPLQHSENIKDQELGISILTDLIKNAKNNADSKLLEEVLFHQKGHYEVIKRFNRFPKRNIYYNSRINTPEENQYIVDETNKKKPY